METAMLWGNMSLLGVEIKQAVIISLLTL